MGIERMKKIAPAPGRLLDTPLPKKWEKRFVEDASTTNKMVVDESDTAFAELVVLLGNISILHGPN